MATEPTAQVVPDVPSVVCAHATRCAGCPLINLPYAEQLSLKRARVLAAAQGYPALESTYIQPTLPANPIVAYRTRAKLVVGVAAGGPAIGLFESGGGHLVLDIPQCRVQSPAILETVAAVRAMLNEFHPGFRGDSDAVTLLRALDVREALSSTVGGGEIAQMLVTFVALKDDIRSPERMAGLRDAARALRERCKVVAGVALSLRETDSPQVLGSELHMLDGASVLSDRVGEITQLATHGAFAQAHRAQAAQIHRLLLEHLGSLSGQKVLDLYGGSGAIGLALARAGANVELVESFAPAVKLAREAARDLPNGGSTARLRETVNSPDAGDVKVGGFQAVVGDVGEVLTRVLRDGNRPDVVIVNPPRRGLAPSVRISVAALEPRAIGYVSCDPDTLTRDLDHFHRLGYAASSIQPLDMIPLTEEVESVVVLTKSPLPLPRVAYADDEVVIVEKPPHEPTTPQGEYASSLLHRVRRLPNADQAVPVHRLDIGTSGLVIFARKAAYVSAWADALGSALSRKIYLCAVRGRTPSKGAITRDLRDEGRMVAARTRYRWLGGAGGHSVLRVIPEQGRTHQIRRHLAAIGHPVLGDERYGHSASNRFFEEKHGLDRTFLHCVRIELTHPRTGLRLVIETPLPPDLRLTLVRVGGPSILKFLEGKSALGSQEPSTLPPASAGRISAAPPSSGQPSSVGYEGTDGPDIEYGGIDIDRNDFDRPTLEHLTVAEPADVDPNPMSVRTAITSDEDV